MTTQETQLLPSADAETPTIQSGDAADPSQTDCASLGQPLPANELGSSVTENSCQEPSKSSGKGGAPLGNRNREKHRGRAHVILGEAPRGFGHVYTAVRNLLVDLEAEFVSKFGPMSHSLRESLHGAGHWLVRSRCLHKWARHPERTDSERNAAMGQSAEAHERYINRLRSIGLAKPDGPDAGSSDHWNDFYKSSQPPTP